MLLVVLVCCCLLINGVVFGLQDWGLSLIRDNIKSLC